MVLVYLILVGKEGKVAVKQIETRRLILRSPMREDAVSLLPIRNSEFVLQFNPTIPKNQEQLMEELIYYGVSAISLSTTGSNQEGLRA